MRSPLRPFTCLLLPFLVAVHECVPLSSGCSPMLGIFLICCAVLAEHASSNASDSESSYRKLLLWFVAFFPLQLPPIACGGHFRFLLLLFSSSSKANGLK